MQRKYLHATKIKQNYVQEERKSKNNGVDSLEVNPHSRDQSNKVPTNKARSLSLGSTKSSKMRLFSSFQIIQITQCGTKFQIYKECLSNQFLQPANKSIILLGKTQATPNNLKAKLHNLDNNCLVNYQSN